MDSFDALIGKLRFFHLRMLEALAQERSVNRASERLHLSQPAISKALKEVEQVFGCVLFERSARGLRTTAQGEVVVRGARVLLQELALVHGTLREAAVSPTHRFRIGSPPIAALAVLPAVVGRLRRDFPGAHVEVHEERVASLFTLLQEGAVDALLTPYNATLMTAPGMQALRFHKLDDAAFVVIASRSHPLTARRQVDLDMLLAEPWIFADTDSYARQMVEAAFVRAGLPPPVPVVVSRSPATNIRLVMQGVGLAVVPRSLVEQETAEGLVKPLALRRALPTTPIALVVRAGAEDRPPVRLLIDTVAGLREGTP